MKDKVITFDLGKADKKKLYKIIFALQSQLNKEREENEKRKHVLRDCRATFVYSLWTEKSSIVKKIDKAINSTYSQEPQ